MSVQNDTRSVITEFVVGGFDSVQRPLAVGVVLLMLYTLTLIANTANICFIVTDKRLHQPMYFFICNLALTDIIYSEGSTYIMSIQNDSRSVITEFVFSGFDAVQRPLAVGVVLLMLYTLTLIANTANICFIVTDKRLHQPMYLFICNLALTDMIQCTSACPTMIAILVVGYKTISYVPCLIQMYVFNVAFLNVLFAIAVMALDRLTAISSPLRYHSIMTNLRCILIVIFFWLVSFALSIILPATVAPLPICYRTIRYLFCDYAGVIRATCVNPEPYFNMVSIIATLIIFGTFSLIFLSYLKICIVVLKMPSGTDKKKALNTCLTHFIVIICFFAPSLTLIVLTRIGVVLTMEERNGLMVGSIVGPSLVNPFIYSLRTREIRNKFMKIDSKNKNWNFK
ncbi:olfactory receptor 6F1-like [Trichomycterus rosablanca]|uniref:olfactory receptor 6F1-like n=1 Tax=Trichomycterus rosablanca TaxID=2290929 RepID=UPI002F35E38B